MKKRKLGQKITFISAIIFYLCGAGFLVATGYYGSQFGTESPVFASFAASIVFFFGAGVVLHVMGSINMPDLRVNRGKPTD
ncbi:MAG: hemerythrin family protein [Sedimenticola sp.]